LIIYLLTKYRIDIGIAILRQYSTSCGYRMKIENVTSKHH